MKKILKILYIITIISSTWFICFVGSAGAGHNTINIGKAAYNSNLEMINFTINIGSGYYKNSSRYGHRRHDRYRYGKMNHYPWHSNSYRHRYSKHKYGNKRHDYSNRYRRHFSPGKIYRDTHSYGYGIKSRNYSAVYQSGFNNGYNTGYNGHKKNPEYVYGKTYNRHTKDRRMYGIYLRGYEKGYLKGYQMR
jgi:hypothetical protein